MCYLLSITSIVLLQSNNYYDDRIDFSLLIISLNNLLSEIQISSHPSHTIFPIYKGSFPHKLRNILIKKRFK